MKKNKIKTLSECFSEMINTDGIETKIGSSKDYLSKLQNRFETGHLTKELQGIYLKKAGYEFVNQERWCKK